MEDFVHVSINKKDKLFHFIIDFYHLPDASTASTLPQQTNTFYKRDAYASLTSLAIRAETIAPELGSTATHRARM